MDGVGTGIGTEVRNRDGDMDRDTIRFSGGEWNTIRDRDRDRFQSEDVDCLKFVGRLEVVGIEALPAEVWRTVVLLVACRCCGDRPFPRCRYLLLSGPGAFIMSPGMGFDVSH